VPGSHCTPEDIHLDDGGVQKLLGSEVWILEKFDGLNVSISRQGKDRLVPGLKMEWHGVLGGGLSRMVHIYIEQRRHQLLQLLRPGEVVFGEWLRHRVSVPYTHLPDAFLAFSIGDRNQRLISAEKARARVEAAGLHGGHILWRGVLKDLKGLSKWARRSAYGPHAMEGVIIERLRGKGPRLAKWVRPDYPHPDKGILSGELNRLSPAAAAQVLTGWPL
jgi:atypical dual specificity phosphatase